MTEDSVQTLQKMLRRLTERYHAIPDLPVDGKFGEETLEGVMRFQNAVGLPVNGMIDQETGQAILEEWRSLERELSQPRQLRGFPAQAVVTPGESELYLYPVQAMFQSLSHVLEDIREETIDGIHNGTSVDNVRWLQEHAGLPVSGNVDRRLWDVLVRLYEMFIVSETEERRQAEYLQGRG